MNETNNEEQSQKPKTSRSAIASLSLGICALLLSIFYPFDQGLWKPLTLLGLAVCTISLFLQNSLIGYGLIISGIIINVFLVTRPYAGKFPSAPAKNMCATNLVGFGKAIMIYAGENDGKYPTADKWCDLLIRYCDMSPSQFICRGSDAVEGESSYAFNKYLVGKKMSEVPGDVVLLFETNFGKNPLGRYGLIGDRDFHKVLEYFHPEREVYKLRWNQVGGPEILTIENHQGKGCNVLFNDTHVKFVKTEDLDRLKWKPEENE